MIASRFDAVRAAALAKFGAVLFGVALLSACVTTRTPLPEATGDGTKDRITASDESDGSKRAKVRMELAAAYFGRGQMTTALDQVKLAIIANPNQSEAYNLRGLIYANLGDDALAEESFRRALQLNPRDADTMQNFGYYLCQKKRYPEANALFDQALAVPRYLDAPRTLLTQGVCQAQAGQLAQAEATLLQSYQLDPGNPSTAVNLSEVLYRRGDYERARFYVRRVNAVPEVANAQTLWLAARIEHRSGNARAAQDFADQLRGRFPDARETGLLARGAFDE
ncbi:MAG: type IV pilus biogenesis/stability protein PilW [Burkholderiales bacterium]|nr:type IV pilus biogenesis/stability protein PilW [Burkholderiales bacterium]